MALVVLKLFIPFTFIDSGVSLNGIVEDGINKVQTIINNEFDISLDMGYLHENTEQNNSSVNILLNEEVQSLESSAGSEGIHSSQVNNQSFISDNPEENRNSVSSGEMNNQWDHSEMVIEMIILGVWLLGVVVTTCTVFICNLHLHRKLKNNRFVLSEKDVPIPVYLSDHIKVPCLFGIFRPSIYLTTECLNNDEMKGQILTHELVHYKQKDHIWALIRTISIILYWYHPMVWIAARLSGTDSELSCDWKTIKILGEENRACYGRTLIKISCENSDNRNLFRCATGITNDAKELKKRLKVMVSKTKKSVFLALISLLCSLLLVGFVFGKEENGIVEVTEYPFSSEILENSLEKVELPWKISEEQSWMENQRAFTLVNEENSIVATISAAGDEKGRSLMFGFMSKRNELTDPNNIQTPVTEEEFLKVLEMAALLYGDFKSTTQLVKDYQDNFDSKSSIKEMNFDDISNSSVLTYSRSGNWITKYGNITCRANFGYMSTTDEMDFQSIGLYNSGDYILFVDDMEEEEIFDPCPEIIDKQITEEEFLAAYEKGYHEESDGFYYSQKPGTYRFFEVQVKDTAYCPEYPLNIKMYFAVNLSEKENNLDRAYIFENEREDYYFLPTAVNYGVSAEPGSANEVEYLNGILGVKRLVLCDENGEAIQQKSYDYNTAFEIQYINELPQEDTSATVGIVEVIRSIPKEEISAFDVTDDEIMMSTTYETDKASCSYSVDKRTGEILSSSYIEKGMDYMAENALVMEEIIKKKFEEAFTIYSEMGGKENEIVSGAYHYTKNSAGKINRGNIYYVFAMENGDFIEIWYNITHDIFWNAARMSDYEIFFEGWEKVDSEGIVEKENTYDFIFNKVFDYSNDMPGGF